MRKYTLMDGDTERHILTGGPSSVAKEPPDVDLVLRVGETYLIHPINPKKLKHRGRRCVYVGYRADTYGGLARVRFEDNGRPGRVEIRDLVPTTFSAPTPEPDSP